MSIYAAMKMKKKKAGKNGETTSRCPECNGNLKLEDSMDDRNVYTCRRCASTITIVQPPKGARKAKHKNRDVFIIRDRSNERKKKVKENTETKKEEPEQKPIDMDPPDHLKTIREAMESKQILTMEYTSSNGEQSTRNIEPYKISKTKKGDILLYGYCLDKEGVRSFKINSIQKLEIQQFGYEPRWDLEDLVKD